MSLLLREFLFSPTARKTQLLRLVLILREHPCWVDYHVRQALSLPYGATPSGAHLTPPSGRPPFLAPYIAGRLNYSAPSTLWSAFLVLSGRQPFSAPHTIGHVDSSAPSSYLVSTFRDTQRTATSTVLQPSSGSRLDHLDRVVGLRCGWPMPQSSNIASPHQSTSFRHTANSFSSSLLSQNLCPCFRLMSRISLFYRVFTFGAGFASFSVRVLPPKSGHGCTPELAIRHQPCLDNTSLLRPRGQLPCIYGRPPLPVKKDLPDATSLCLRLTPP